MNIATSRSNHLPRRAGQKGVVLFTSLILVLILTLVGILLARSETVEETISENDQDHELAVQAAEATLRFAEVGLYAGLYTNFADNTAGLYTWQSGTTDAYQLYNLSSPAGNLLAYGGAPLSQVAATPQFLIESLPSATLPGMALGNPQYSAPTPPVYVYRITAYSYGGDLNTTAELQEIDWQ